MKKKRFFLTILSCLAICTLQAQQTQKVYLSGTGLGHTVNWQFRCTAGRNSGKWSKIEVPSQWELQGFGEYTYGRWYKKKGVKNPSMEEGTYRRTLKVPADWRGKDVRLWFDGVMTDTEVLINGISAGEVHKGGFYRFSYDVTGLLEYGKSNKVEVRVKKHSDNKSVNAAERKADWWLFGGIYRPVWLEVKPISHIERLAVDAKADGTLKTEVCLKNISKGEKLSFELIPLTATGEDVHPLKGQVCDGVDEVRGDKPLLQQEHPVSAIQVNLAIKDNLEIKSNLDGNLDVDGNLVKSITNICWKGIKAWTPETPYLYTLKVSLLDKTGSIIHTMNTRVGFRTIDFRPRDGIYLNGTKLVMKGINRHSFYPDGGRTTNKEISLQDVKLIKEMNMNAVRSHYPPDEHFLDACDSLGLLYIDELAGWQNAYDTSTGKKLVKEMVCRDVNHPCIVLWSNGNEGGWNTALDTLFRAYDPQRRHVIHPWADFDELDTHHYPTYLTGVGRFTNGYKIFMPTEFMHGMYDQGLGAGLEDFWARYTAHPLFAGGFMWAFCDEAVRRSDRNGELDSDDYNAPDGIVGPYREKEGSFYSVREIWSPLKVGSLMITPSFNGHFLVSNRYLFTNLNECTMCYRVLRCPSPLFREHKDGQMAQHVNAITEKSGAMITLDSGSVQLPALLPGETGYAKMTLPQNFFEGDVLELTAYAPDGQLVCTRTYPVLSAGSYLKREEQRGGNSVDNAEIYMDKSLTGNDVAHPVAGIDETDSLITLRSAAVSVVFRRGDATIASVVRNGDRQEIPFTNGPLPVGMKVRLVSLNARMEQGDAILCVRYKGAVDSIVWRMHPDGLLSMNAVLLNKASGGGGFDDAFTDEAVYNFGFTFSYPEKSCTGMRWLGRGPYRVWKNRIPGTNYGIWEKAYNNTITGESHGIPIRKGNDTPVSLVYPEFKGYHANLYWATIQSPTVPFTVYASTDGVFLRVFTPEEPHGRQDGVNTMPDFPAGDISFLLDIPAIRSFKPTSQQGPQSQPGTIRIKKGDEGLRLGLLFDFRKD